MGNQNQAERLQQKSVLFFQEMEFDLEYSKIFGKKQFPRAKEPRWCLETM
jgi:hypothetical protein